MDDGDCNAEDRDTGKVLPCHQIFHETPCEGSAFVLQTRNDAVMGAWRCSKPRSRSRECMPVTERCRVDTGRVRCGQGCRRPKKAPMRDLAAVNAPDLK